jgi:dihydrofolate reductase
MTVLTLVAALDRNRAIGRDNTLPWHLPDDLKRFKALTMGKPVLMGRRTAESLGRALPGRRNLVLTRSGRAPFPGMEVFDSLDAALATLAGDHEVMVIGGGELYRQLLPRADRMHLTHVDVAVDAADAFFPAFDAGEWTITTRSRRPAGDQHALAFDFVDYVRAQGAVGRVE